jgi:hypothetical protein
VIADRPEASIVRSMSSGAVIQERMTFRAGDLS